MNYENLKTLLLSNIKEDKELAVSIIKTNRKDFKKSDLYRLANLAYIGKEYISGVYTEIDYFFDIMKEEYEFNKK